LAPLLLVVLAGCGVGRATAPTSANGSSGKGAGVVSKEVDGDTIHVRIGGSDEKVRFIGINTPETHGPGGLRECFGQEASKRMTELLPVGTPVNLTADVDLRDRYGRLLAYVYRSRDHLFVNLAMVQQGYAEAYTFPPNVAHVDEFVSAAAKARDAGRGLWSKCGGPHKPID
jgi:micrococcal nuclease